MTTPSASPKDSHRGGDAESWPLLERLASDRRHGVIGPLPRRRDHRIGCLARRSPEEPAAALCLLAELGPELATMCRRLVRAGLDADEAEALSVSVAWEVVKGHRRARRVRLPGGLAEWIWREVRQESGLRRLEVDTVELVGDIDAPVLDSDHLERWPGLLAAAVAAGVLTPRQVVIIAQSRMEERPLAEVAAALGRPYAAVRKERFRAERALRVFALSYDWTSS